MIVENVEEFNKLLKKLISLGWLFDGNPTEDEIKKWAAMGRSLRPMIYYREIKGNDLLREAYLVRGRRAYCVSKFTDSIITIGEWTAWYVDSAQKQ